MPLTTAVSGDKNLVTIRIEGRFDFNVHRDFRDAYKERIDPGAEYVVDLRDVDYMDSSALGMLLLLREHGGRDKARVSIVNAGPEIKKILTIANFNKLFEIR